MRFSTLFASHERVNIRTKTRFIFLSSNPFDIQFISIFIFQKHYS